MTNIQTTSKGKIDGNSLKVAQRLCCVCDKPYYGRSDKIYCDDHCRNRYHAELRKHTKTAAQVKTKIMYKNYAILCLLMAGKQGKIVIKKRELQKQLFDFDVVTGVTNSPLGLKFELFEFSYYFSSNYNVVIQQDTSEHKFSPFVYKRWERHWKLIQTDFESFALSSNSMTPVNTLKPSS